MRDPEGSILPVLWANFLLTITYDLYGGVRLGPSDPSSPQILVRNRTAKRRKFRVSQEDWLPSQQSTMPSKLF